MAVYPTFENKAVRDEAKSIEEGREVLKDEIWVTIRVDGNTELHYAAEEWLALTQDNVRRGKIPQQNLDVYKSLYNAFKEGQEPPLNGLDIRHWPQVTRATAENMIRNGIRTVEDLSEADENSLRRLGHGARDFQKKAKAYLESKDGKAAEKIIALEEKMAELASQNEQLMAALNEKVKKKAK